MFEGRPAQGAFLPMESAGLPGLRQVLVTAVRDGDVGAQTGLGELVDEAFVTLPSGREWKVSVRSDSAACQGDLLDRWAELEWRFEVSADMSPQLRAEVVALPGDAWRELSVEPDGFVREWAEVVHAPSRTHEKMDGLPDRHLAIRVRPPRASCPGTASGCATSPWSPTTGTPTAAR